MFSEAKRRFLKEWRFYDSHFFSLYGRAESLSRENGGNAQACQRVIDRDFRRVSGVFGSHSNLAELWHLSDLL